MELIRESHRHFLYAISWKYPYILFCFFFPAVEFVGYAKSVVALIAKEAEYIGKEAGERERDTEKQRETEQPKR